MRGSVQTMTQLRESLQGSPAQYAIGTYANMASHSSHVARPHQPTATSIFNNKYVVALCRKPIEDDDSEVLQEAGLNCNGFIDYNKGNLQ